MEVLEGGRGRRVEVVGLERTKEMKSWATVVEGMAWRKDRTTWLRCWKFPCSRGSRSVEFVPSEALDATEPPGKPERSSPARKVTLVLTSSFTTTA